jgi:hypothetical protein
MSSIACLDSSSAIMWEKLGKGSLWVRLSAQAYNQFNEYERLADAFRG